MELQFLWIQSYNNINNIGFNFLSNNDYEYDSQTRKLTYKSNDDAPFKLFNDSVLNINAIIGRNGSGKSSLLSFIRRIFSSHPMLMSGYNFLLIAKKTEKEFLIIDKDINQGTKLELIGIPNTFKVEITNDLKTIHSDVDLIYYTNSLSIYDELVYGEDFYNASLFSSLYRRTLESNKYLVNSIERLDKELGFPNVPDDRQEDYNVSKNRYIKSALPISLLYINELRTKINFISRFKELDFDFIPKTIELNFNHLFTNNNLDSFSEIKNIDTLIYLINRDNNSTELEAKIKRLEEGIIINSFLFIIKNQIFSETRNLNNAKVITLINECQNINNIPQIILNYIKGAELFPGDNMFNRLHSFLDGLNDKIKKLEFFNATWSNYFVLSIDKNFKSFFNEISDFWYDSDFIFHFTWHNLSAGESAFLTLFARINLISERDNLNETIWIIIDEGELYLHPEWQRGFIKKLHDYLPKFFIEKKNDNKNRPKNIQILLTSHSPFIASDLPRSNIILLDKSEKGYSQLLESNTMSETFGANIFELLSDSFFLNDSQIGDFAKNKINDLFKFLNNEESEIKWDNTKAEKLISLIGEPIVKNQLIELYDKMYKTEKEIEYLEKERQRIDMKIDRLRKHDSDST